MTLKTKKFLQHCIVLVSYIALTAIFTYPLITHFSTHLLGDGYDGSQYPISLWWVQKAITKLHTTPFFSDYMFYPLGSSLALHTMVFLNGLIGIALQAFFSLTVTQNILTFATFILSSYGMFLLVRDLGCGVRSAFLGGVIFGFCPYRLINGLGFYNLLGTQWIPFYFLFLIRLAQQPSWYNGIGTGIFLLCTVYTSYNYAVFLGLSTGVYFIYLFISERTLLTKQLFKYFTLSGAIVLVGSSPMLYQLFFDLMDNGATASGEVVGTDVLLFLIPSVLHPFLGKAAMRISTQLTPYISMSTVYVGYSVILLTILALAYRKKFHPLINYWCMLGGIFFLFALGPYLQVYGKRTFSIAGFNFSIPLPHLILLNVPFLDGTRITARFSIILMLSLAILSAYFCSLLLKRIDRSYGKGLSLIVLGVILGTILGEYVTFPYPALDNQRIPHVYSEIIGNDIEDVSVLQIPLEIKSGTQHLAIGSTKLDFYQVAHQKRLIGGYLARVPEQVFAYFSKAPIISHLIMLQQGQHVSPEAIQMDKQVLNEFLQLFKLKYIVLHRQDDLGRGFFLQSDRKAILDRMEEYVTTLFPVHKIEETSELTAYKINHPFQKIPAPATQKIDFGTPLSHLYRVDGWSRDERWNQKFPFVWATGKSSTALFRLKQSSEVTCTLRLAPFLYPNAPEQSVKIFLNNTFIKKLTLNKTGAWETFAVHIPEKATIGGINKLRFEYGYAASPHTVLNIPDNRRLAVAFDYIEIESAVRQ